MFATHSNSIFTERKKKMKKVVSVLFSMLLVGFLIVAKGAIADEAPEFSSKEEAIFGSDPSGNENLEDSETINRLLIEETETPGSENPYLEEDYPLTGSSEEQVSAPSDSVPN
jgi:hypothetical protein